MRVVRTAPVVSESDLERTCTEFLELDGWRTLKTDPVSRREWGKGFGERGMADMQYRRYWQGCIDQVAFSPPYESWCQLIWIEWKTPRGRIAHHQHAWREREQARGALALIAGIDFPATIEGFVEFYRKSGLMRRNISLGGTAHAAIKG